MFENVEFKGTFRSYQQKILGGAEDYLSDGKINIVAAPGSGKTVLGLELIRRLSKPCIVLSPTTTVRDQWGERFKESFVKDGDDTGYVSFDLKNLADITSVTYQSLYAAIERAECDGEDYSELDLFKTVKDRGVGVLCLDEAHHLQNEWQRALEKFVAFFGDGIKIISLTATPPYDATAGEWKRYVDVCGEIDEEIFVPELVEQGTLCPHQDYVWFTFPTKEEAKDFGDFSARVDKVMKELKSHPAILSACKTVNMRTADKCGWLDGNYAEVIACMQFFRRLGLDYDRKLYKYLSVDKALRYTLKTAETAVNFILKTEELLLKNQCEELLYLFRQNGLYERGKVTLKLNDKLKKELVASAGKLKGIAEIASLESKNLGERLRLLVLTDYIKKESVSDLGKGKKFDNLSVVSVFETLRTSSPYPCAALSGSLVILPVKCAETLGYMGVNHTFKPIENTDYAEFNIKGGNREKVNAVDRLFERGEICALVGTKSLLGEGWDSPCINSLVLASFVGSFMLSNQMRGRAIRTDKSDPYKTANIWHLVTVFEGEDKNEINSYDFDVLKRRFDCFVAPSYSFDVIESGVGRITTVEPPFDSGGFNRINKATSRLAKDREELRRKWDSSLSISSEIFRKTEVPADRQLPAFTFYNVSRTFFLCTLLTAIIAGLCEAFLNITNTGVNVFLGILGAGLIFFLGGLLVGIIERRFLRHSNPQKSIKNLTECILETFKELGKVTSDCTVKVDANDIGTVINISLTGATVREQRLFSDAVRELFSPIESPRYVLIPHGKVGYDYKSALVCPSALGANKEYADRLADNLKRTTGKLRVVFTRNQKGRKFLRKCRKKAYITLNARNVEEIFGNC
jgi:superfamily II DNA or RNA helicase